ncbi:hypothetical protein MPSEU_000171800 [Mayamaea pseudoterrestris]|nr:hypothetical protein MPSEU_000171800 [Mayamaea pseudoterrestris]
MAPYEVPPTLAQLIAIAMTPRVTGVFSMLGSGYIVHDCWRQLRTTVRGRGGIVSTAHTYQRLMIGLSVSDMIMTFGFVLSTLPIPRDTPYIWGNVGNTKSCAFAGMFTTFGVVPTMYNASLSIYYLLRIRHGWTPTQLRKVETWLHIVPWVWGVCIVVASLSLKLFNSGYFECWLAPFPQGCNPSFKSTPENPPTCIRGDNIELYQWGFDLIPKLISIIIVTINMYLTWYSVHQQEKQTKKFTEPAAAVKEAPDAAAENSGEPTETMLSKAKRWTDRLPNPLPPSLQPWQVEAVKLSVAQRLAIQSYLYVGALYVSITPVVIARTYEETHGTIRWTMLFFVSLFMPAQGICNALVYLRPRYLQYRKDETKRRKLEEQIMPKPATQEANSTCSDEAEKEPSQPLRASQKSRLQTLGDTMRDGAVDDEAELVYIVGSLEQPETEPRASERMPETNEKKTRFWSFSSASSQRPSINDDIVVGDDQVE